MRAGPPQALIRISHQRSLLNEAAEAVMKEWVCGGAQRGGMKCRGKGESIGGVTIQMLSFTITHICGMLHSN